jgi:outer membrane lipoprotein-sorting protein
MNLFKNPKCSLVPLVPQWLNKEYMKFSSLHILLFSLLTMHNASAQDSKETPIKDPANLIGQINQASAKTNTITADFSQEKEMSFMEEKVISSGKFYFRKDKQLRWEYTEPFEFAIILNGDRIRIIDEGKSKDFEAGSNRMFLEISDVMTGMVNGSLLSSSKFTATWSEAAGYYKAELIPNGTAMKDFLMRIELKVSKQDFTVEELKMFEQSGDYTRITFRNKKLNETVPAEIFRLD